MEIQHTPARAYAEVAGLVMASTVLLGCYALRPSSGAGQTRYDGARKPDARSIATPPGFRVEVMATNLTFPTGVTFDGQGRVHVVESGYSYGEVFNEPRLLRLDPGGPPIVIASGGSSGPWTGVAYHAGNFYVADGNVRTGGQVLRIAPDGQTQILIADLPAVGDHHTNGPIVSSDGWVYFGQGAATNSGIVGPDNLEFGWLKRHPAFHDRPARDIRLTGENFETPDVLNPTRRSVLTGAFLPFGTPSERGQIIRGSARPTGAVLRVRADGSSAEPEIVAWGLRNPFGLAFAPDGALYVTENGADDRGSRPIWGAPDVLWRIEPGTWYGWPDYVAGVPVTVSQFNRRGNPPLRFLMVEHPNPPPRSAARFAVHSSANGFDFSRETVFGYQGQAFVAIFGDMAPAVGKVMGPLGGKVVRVDPGTGVITDFAANRADREGPASKVGGAGFERPIAARFDPSGESLYVVDFGVMLMDGKTPRPIADTGVLWRITRQP